MPTSPEDPVRTSNVSETLVHDGRYNLQGTPGKRHLTTWSLFTLSLGMAGAQVAWTIELGLVRRFPFLYPFTMI